MYKSKAQYSESYVPTEWWFKNAAGVTTSSGTGGFTLVDFDRKIDYHVGRDKSTFRPCSHEVFEYNLGSSQIPVYYYGDVLRSGSVGLPPFSKEDLLGTIDMSSFPDQDAFASRAVRSMTPSMATGMSGSNFLLELPEIASLKQFLPTLRDIFFYKGRKKKTLGSIADASLQYNFGIKPLVSDLKSIYEGLTSLKERMSNLQNEAGKPQLRHYTEKQSIGPLDWTLGAPTGYHHLVVSSFDVVDTATMAFSYTLPDLSRWRRTLYSVLDTLGLHLNASVVWEAIPYSFVVDWFFNVGDFIDQFSDRWLEPNLHINSFGISRKYEFTCTQYYKRTYFSDTTDSPYTVETQGSTARYKRYLRRVAEPSPHWFSIEQFGKLNARKIYLGACLVYQQAR